MKLYLSQQDRDDYEQELSIKKWLDDGDHGEIELKSVTRNGKCKHIGDMGSFSMDEKVGFDQDSGTYADIIGRCDEGIEKYGELYPEDEIEVDETKLRIELVVNPLNIESRIKRWAIETYLCKTNSSK